LSPARLPIPPPGHVDLLFTARHKDSPKFFFPKCFYQKVLTVVYLLII